jgi:beta-ureidopropionase / N-carbamoyl-L-amino-acid hydrolase
MPDHGHETTRQADDLLADFRDLSRIGATDNGGVERQAATPSDGASRAWLRQWLSQRGFRVANDRIGNMFGLHEFTPGAPYVLGGSHLDSQPRGGRFDGAYGVLAAAYAADRLRRRYAGATAKPRFNLGVVNWFNEEGSRFTHSMMGSGVFSGKLDLADAVSLTDRHGTTVEQALRALDELGDTDVLAPAAVAAFAEIHIEQGAILDKEGIDIGLVTSTWAANKYNIVVHGAQAHTGATPMADRKDALYGAALAVVAVRELADRFGEELHTSCGQFDVTPNSPVVVPAQVDLHLDLRSSSQSLLDQADAALHRRLAEIEVQADVRIERRFAHRWSQAPYPDTGVQLASEVAGELGLSTRNIRTRAGHDSTNLKDLVPTIMLFVPSVNGISHNELEYTADSDLVRGVDMLTGVLDRLIHGACA